MQPLADLGYNGIAVNNRGVRDLKHYKMTMAKDIHTQYHDKLQIDQAIMLRSDIDSMAAVSLAPQFKEDVMTLITGG